MVTRDQAVGAYPGQTFHYTGRSACVIVTGPRGGQTEKVTRVRVSGKCQTWKTRGDFRLPVKYGLYESSAIDQDNADQFHSPADCPAGIAF